MLLKDLANVWFNVKAPLTVDATSLPPATANFAASLNIFKERLVSLVAD